MSTLRVFPLWGRDGKPEHNRGLTYLGDSRWELAAPRSQDEVRVGKWDGIGSAIAALRWSGSHLRVRVERVACWLPRRKWADFWWATRETAQVWPLRYARFRANQVGAGIVLGPEPADQRIVMTMGPSTSQVDSGRQLEYLVSYQNHVAHICPLGEHWRGRTFSLPARRDAVTEILWYCEGCVVEITVHEMK